MHEHYISGLEANDSPAWFAGSKITDKQGRPLLMFHGTAESFKEFRTPAFFTSCRDVADEYADLRGGADGRVEEVFLSIKKPATDSDVRRVAHGIGLSDEMVFALIDPRQNGGKPNQVIDLLQAQGFDGAITSDYDASGEPFAAFVAFSPEQIRRVAESPGLLSSHSRRKHGLG